MARCQDSSGPPACLASWQSQRSDATASPAGQRRCPEHVAWSEQLSCRRCIPPGRYSEQGGWPVQRTSRNVIVAPVVRCKSPAQVHRQTAQRRPRLRGPRNWAAPIRAPRGVNLMHRPSAAPSRGRRTIGCRFRRPSKWYQPACRGVTAARQRGGHRARMAQDRATGFHGAPPGGRPRSWTFQMVHAEAGLCRLPPPNATSCGGVGARRWWTKRWASHSPEYWSAISTPPTTITMAPSNGAGPTCCGISTTWWRSTPRTPRWPSGPRQSISSCRGQVITHVEARSQLAWERQLLVICQPSGLGAAALVIWPALPG